MINKKKIITAGLWVLVVFGLSQLLRLGSNLVVTRLLEPEMFGIMTLVYAVLRGLAMFSDLGLLAFIVRHKDGTDPEILNTVWTIQVIRGWFMFIAIGIGALSLLAMSKIFGINLGAVYGNDDLPFLLIAVGFTAVISGYKTMASAVLSRELNHGRLEIIDFTAQFIATIVMLVWAWLYPSIWSLVSAAIVAALVNLLLNYQFFNLRHKLKWNKSVANQVFAFGKWIFLASILTYLAQQGDILIFATSISPAQLGVYSIAFMLSTVISSVVVQIVSKIWFPVLSHIANKKPTELKEKYYEIRKRQDLIIFFFIGILVAIAPDIISLLYDERFHEAGWMMQILSFTVLGVAMSLVGLECLSALGITKIRMKVMFVRSLSIFVGLPVLFHFYGLVGAIWGVVLSNFVGLPFQYMEMKKQKIFSFYKEIRMIPMVAIGYLSCYVLMNSFRHGFS